MNEALREAKKALEAGEIPVGAVVALAGKIIGRGRNMRAEENSPIAHAEIMALNDAARTINNWRLDNCSVYVTLEPCVMCAGAMVQCRVGRIVYGAKDPKAGATGSLYNIPNDPRMYHRCEVVGGVMREACAKILQEFFAKRRL